MTNSAMMPNAERIYWYDADGEYHSKVFTNLASAQELYKQLRAAATIDPRRVGRKPLYNYQPDAECGIDSTGQPFEYDTEPLPLLNPGI